MGLRGWGGAIIKALLFVTGRFFVFPAANYGGRRFEAVRANVGGLLGTDDANIINSDVAVMPHMHGQRWQYIWSGLNQLPWLPCQCDCAARLEV